MGEFPALGAVYAAFSSQNVPASHLTHGVLDDLKNCPFPLPSDDNPPELSDSELSFDSVLVAALDPTLSPEPWPSSVASVSPDPSLQSSSTANDPKQKLCIEIPSAE
jgi:hypothetical protein